MSRISSDASAKVSSTVVVLILIGVGMGAVAGVAFLTNIPTEKEYTISITVNDMQIASESGYAHNVIRDAGGVPKYWNPHTEAFDINTPSNEAALFVTVRLDDKTIDSEKRILPVQNASAVPIPGGSDLGIEMGAFKVKTSSDSISLSTFLKTGTGEDGAVVDIYNPLAGTQGTRLYVDLEKGAYEYILTGHPLSPLVGYLKITVTIS